MRRSTVVNLNRVKFAQFLGKNHLIILLTFMFITGVAAGSITIGKSQNVLKLSEYFLNTYVSQRTGVSFFSVLFSSFFTSLLTVLFVFVSGASMLGVITVPIWVMLRGFLYGAVSSFLYSEYSVKGIAFNAVMVIPAAVVFVISFLLAAKESVKFSVIMAKLTLPRSKPVNLYIDFRNYCGRYAFFCVAILISALIDAVLSCSFIKFFQL